MKPPHSVHFSNRYLRLLLVITGIASCLFVIQAAARYGFSQLLITYAVASGNLSAAKKAIELTPKDPEAHLAGAALLSLLGTPEQGVVEFEKAVALRPADYRLWSELGLLRDQIGDTQGALSAFDEAVRHAPFYSQPRWNRGNVLLRKGEYEAAFNDLNHAAESNPELVPSLIDLAWGIARGDVKLTEQLAQIEGDQKRIAFARLLARRGKAEEALAQIERASIVPEAIKRELVEQLLGKGGFKEAFAIWKSTEGIRLDKNAAAPSIYDGGFEGPLSFNQGGFSWRVPGDLQATTVSLDSGKPQSGSRDLRIEFKGNSNPALPVVSQIVLVEPTQPNAAAEQGRAEAKRYQVNFYARSQDVVTGGLPFLAVRDAGDDQKNLGQSRPLPAGTGDWQAFSFEFTTKPETKAVVLSLQRENCTTSPCPIFGSIYLDSFSIAELK